MFPKVVINSIFEYSLFKTKQKLLRLKRAKEIESELYYYHSKASKVLIFYRR